MPERDEYEEQMRFSRRLVAEGRRGRVVQDAEDSGEPSGQPAQTSTPDWGAGARPGGQPVETDDMSKLLRAARWGVDPNRLP